MFEVATWITNHPIVIPFIIAIMAYGTFRVYMAIWGVFESAVGYMVTIIVKAVTFTIKSIKSVNWVTPRSITWR